MSSAGHRLASGWNRAFLARMSRCPRDSGLLCRMVRFGWAMACRIGLRLYHRMTIIGRENLPRRGPFVIVANHASHLDAPCLLAALPTRKIHRAYPVAAADYFFNSVPGATLAAVCMNAMPFDRSKHVGQSIGLCRKVLGGPDNVLIVFPEGTRTSTGTVGPFRRGIGDLVAGRNIRVVPCYIDGSFEAWPKGRWLPRPRKLTLHVGRAMCFSDRDPSKTAALEISRELRQAVLALKRSNHNHGITSRNDRIAVTCGV